MSDRSLSPAQLSIFQHNYVAHLVDGDRNKARHVVHDAISLGATIPQLYLGILQKSQYEIGRLWESNQVTVAHEHFASTVTQQVMAEFYPRLMHTSVAKTGKRLLGASVDDELHEIGIRMVCDLFLQAGWDAYFIGSNTPTDALVKAIEMFKPDVVALSATMYGHLASLKASIDVIRANPATAALPILVGGYPFTKNPQLWQHVGADGTATDASGAVALAKSLLSEGKTATPKKSGDDMLAPVSDHDLAMFERYSYRLIDAVVDRMSTDAMPSSKTLANGMRFFVAGLVTAMALGDTSGISEQIEWANRRREYDGLPKDTLGHGMQLMRSEARALLPASVAQATAPYLDYVVDKQTAVAG